MPWWSLTKCSKCLNHALNERLTAVGMAVAWEPHRGDFGHLLHDPVVSRRTALSQRHLAKVSSLVCPDLRRLSCSSPYSQVQHYLSQLLLQKSSRKSKWKCSPPGISEKQIYISVAGRLFIIFVLDWEFKGRMIYSLNSVYCHLDHRSHFHPKWLTVGFIRSMSQHLNFYFLGQKHSLTVLVLDSIT